MTYKLYNHLDAQGINTFEDWTKSLQTAQRAKLNQKLDALELNGMDLFPQMLTGTPEAGILKLRVKGNVQLRPLLCLGPIHMQNEFTLLLGAKEVGSKWDPTKAPALANQVKFEIIEAQTSITTKNKRRVRHARVS